MFGSILAIDLGGYQMAMDLCKDPIFGQYAGIIVSAIFGYTIVFTIPAGLGAFGAEDRPYFTKGILLGLVAIPVGLIAGGILCCLPIGQLLWNLIPILLVFFLIIGLLKNPEVLIQGFQYFAIRMLPDIRSLLFSYKRSSGFLLHRIHWPYPVQPGNQLPAGT